MNYQKIYEDLIKKGRTRDVIVGYSENHHIVPKCMGGTDSTDNIVKLTGREHFIAHVLLCKIYPENTKLLYAFNCMRNKWGKTRTYKVSSNNYSILRAKFSKVQSASNTGKVAWNKGLHGVYHVTEETKELLSKKFSGSGNPMYGKKVSEKVSKAVAAANKRRVWTDEMRKKGRKRGSEHPRFGKHWDENYPIKYTTTKCYKILKQFPTNIVSIELWEKYHFKPYVSLKTIIKFLGSFENMVKSVNERYDSNFKMEG